MLEYEPGTSVLLLWGAALLKRLERATSVQDTPPRVEVPGGGGGSKDGVAALACHEVGIHS